MKPTDKNETPEFQLTRYFYGASACDAPGQGPIRPAHRTGHHPERDLMKFLASFFGIGYLPLAPGTWASLAAALIAWFLQPYPGAVIAAALMISLLGVWSGGKAALALGQKDPSCVVIDEVAGMLLAVAGLPARWEIYLSAFILFRLLDIFKPGPIRRAENLPGGWGIMADDLLAGLAVNLLFRVVGVCVWVFRV